MTVRFFPESDHAQVFGIPGVYWQQRGNYFTRDGRYVPGDPDREREIGEIETQLTDPKLPSEVREALRKRLAEMKAAEPEPVVVAAPKPDLRRKENQHLRGAMERIYGGAEDDA